MNIRKNIDYSEMYEELDKLMEQQLPQMELYCAKMPEVMYEGRQTTMAHYPMQEFFLCARRCWKSFLHFYI